MNLPTHNLKRLIFAFAILCLSLLSKAQDITVKGKVLDAGTGKPLENANIVGVRSKKGVISNAAGEFSISLPKTDKLMISFYRF